MRGKWLAPLAFTSHGLLSKVRRVPPMLLFLAFLNQSHLASIQVDFTRGTTNTMRIVVGACEASQWDGVGEC